MEMAAAKPYWAPEPPKANRYVYVISRSVEPTVESVGGNGPPCVVSCTALKLLKLNANDEISSGVRDTSSSGSVTRRNRLHTPAPSTLAASVSSPGIACNAPVDTRNMYG